MFKSLPACLCIKISILALGGFYLSACVPVLDSDLVKAPDNEVEGNNQISAEDRLLSLYTNYVPATDEIIRRAHEAAGGEVWRYPKTLFMEGYAVFYKDGVSLKHDRHRMWRIYEADKRDAHRVDGKVRILSERSGQSVIDLSYDGNTTYTENGPQAKSQADKQWSSSFGFGVIRHALDEGYNLERLPDDLIDGKLAYMVRVHDPNGGTTHFGISQSDFRILKVGFDTNRGWHERIYSNFFINSDPSPKEAEFKPQQRAWVQPGRVRLYYNGVKSNEVIWTIFSINSDLPDCKFVLPEVQNCGD